MCDECRQSPCHPRCPNAPEVIVAGCEICDNPIHNGEMAFIIDGRIYCEECVYGGHTTMWKDDD